MGIEKKLYLTPTDGNHDTFPRKVLAELHAAGFTDVAESYVTHEPEKPFQRYVQQQRTRFSGNELEVVMDRRNGGYDTIVRATGDLSRVDAHQKICDGVCSALAKYTAERRS